MNRLRLSDSGCGLFTCVVMLLGGCTASSPDHSIDSRGRAEATTDRAPSVASVGTGGLGSATGNQPGAAECQIGSGISPGTSPLRRLTHAEYDNTVGVLLGVTSKPARAFPLEERAFGFQNNASARSVSPILAEHYEGAASRVSSSLGNSALLSCEPATVGEDVCGAHFIDEFGLKSYRRPLTPVEQSQMLAPPVPTSRETAPSGGNSRLIAGN